MEKLIEALQIFLKYGNTDSPTHCEHDIMMVDPRTYNKDDMSEEDVEKLRELGFTWSSEYDCFTSFRYGSC